MGRMAAIQCDRGPRMTLQLIVWPISPMTGFGRDNAHSQNAVAVSGAHSGDVCARANTSSGGWVCSEIACRVLWRSMHWRI